MDHVLKPAVKSSAQLISENPNFSVFKQALIATGYYDTLDIVSTATPKRFYTVLAETNKDLADSTGAPLLRSIPVVAAVGNHDALTRDLDRFPGALAYYHFWEQPLNGPEGKEGDALVPLLKASDANRKAFMEGAGEKYPRMTNFSFDYGNAHWTVLDSNPYVEWNDSLLKNWVSKK